MNSVNACAMLLLALDSIGYMPVNVPLVISLAHVCPFRDFSLKNKVSM